MPPTSAARWSTRSGFESANRRSTSSDHGQVVVTPPRDERLHACGPETLDHVRAEKAAAPCDQDVHGGPVYGNGLPAPCDLAHRVEPRAADVLPAVQRPCVAASLAADRLRERARAGRKSSIAAYSSASRYQSPPADRRDWPTSTGETAFASVGRPCVQASSCDEGEALVGRRAGRRPPRRSARRAWPARARSRADEATSRSGSGSDAAAEQHEVDAVGLASAVARDAPRRGRGRPWTRPGRRRRARRGARAGDSSTNRAGSARVELVDADSDESRAARPSTPKRARELVLLRRAEEQQAGSGEHPSKTRRRSGGSSCTVGTSSERSATCGSASTSWRRGRSRTRRRRSASPSLARCSSELRRVRALRANPLPAERESSGLRTRRRKPARTSPGRAARDGKRTTRTPFTSVSPGRVVVRPA